MPIALLPHSLHTGRGTTRLEKSLRHNKTDCIITFFFFFFSPLQGAFVLLTSPAKGGMGTKKKEEGEGGRETDRGSRAAQSIPIFVRLPRHPGRKRAKETKEADGWQDGVEG